MTLDSRSGYQPALDGVRALAISAVLIAHLPLPVWTHTEQGFVGVYVFFALSGFLITSLLLGETAKHGSISFWRFWLRRAARLLPVVAALVLVVLALTFIAGTGDVHRQSAPAVILYVGNWLSALGGGDAALGALFAHTWSLSVEEQFYILWPLLLAVVLRFGGRRAAIATTAVLILASMSLRVWTYDPESPWRAIRGTDTMADLLLFGCLLALLLMPGTGSHDALRRYVAPWSGPVGLVVMLAFMVVPMERSVVHLIGAPLTAIAACALMLHLTDQRSWVLTRALGKRPVVFVGLISYSLYVWHPLAIFTVETLIHEPLLASLVAAVTSIGIATISFFAFERPIRMGVIRRIPPRTHRVESDLDVETSRRAGRAPRQGKPAKQPT